jgi:branched-chain amino acid aminotransferase
MSVQSAPISITRSTAPLNYPPQDALGFGKYFSPHVFVMDYQKGKGWNEPRITPYQPFMMGPAASVLHYGQALFEGLKAFRTHDGRSVMFRVQDHAQRMARSTARLAMPEIDPAWIRRGIEELVRTDQDWIPTGPESALYLRPTIVANEEFLGVKPADSYYFFVIGSPVGTYYSGAGWTPVRIWVEDQHVRAAPGGLGAIKAAANYASSLAAAADAKTRGYAQVLWLDATHRKYLEEVGTMNVFVRIGDRLLTPALDGTILAGMTRNTVLTLAREWGLSCEERSISLDELKAAHTKGDLLEVFGSGTAAVITPVSELGHREGVMTIGNGQAGEWSRRFYDQIGKIQRAIVPNKHGWLTDI